MYVFLNNLCHTLSANSSPPGESDVRYISNGLYNRSDGLNRDREGNGSGPISRNRYSSDGLYNRTDGLIRDREVIGSRKLNFQQTLKET